MAQDVHARKGVGPPGHRGVHRKHLDAGYWIVWDETVAMTHSGRAALVAQAAELGAVFTGRAAKYDSEASFPYEDFTDLRDAGFLGLCIPSSSGGLGAGFATYCRVANELARYAPATALAFNMHCVTMLLVGQIADDLEWGEDQRDALDARRSALFAGVIEQGDLHSQPFSEGNAPGATAGIQTRAEPVTGGYRVSGRKIFASLSEAANIHNIVAVVPGDERVRFLGVPADAAGVHIEGDWDPLGMRATLSRTLVFDEVFVPVEHEWLPAGGFDQAAARWPHFYLTLSFSYLGLMHGILDATHEYLVRSGRQDHPLKQQGWAEMQVQYEQARALQHAAVDEAGLDPTPEQLRRAWAAVVTVMEAAPSMAATALRVAGGRALLKPEPLERLYRDARCGAVMLPWSVEACLERLGRFALSREMEAPA